jgi:hypothetical protein
MENEVEVVKAEVIENGISIIEKSHKSAILSVHENMQQLVNDCLSIQVSEDDKESYEKAVELKRIVKATHVSIEKKRKEVKQPLIDYGKRLDRWVEEIYTPLVNAEKIVKKKMEVYELKQEKLKQERKLIEDAKEKEQQQLEIRLKNLNSQLEKINSAKNKAELKEVEVYLDSIKISDFGIKSNEAGFILNQLKMTCSMASRLMKDDDEVIVEAPKLETTPITDDLFYEIKLNDPPKESVKKVEVENETKNTQEVISNEEFISEEVVNKEIVNEETTNVSNPLKESIKASDDDVLNILNQISVNVITDVISLIDERTKSFLSNEESFRNLDFSEHKELIYSEAKKFVGVLLSKKVIKK